MRIGLFLSTAIVYTGDLYVPPSPDPFPLIEEVEILGVTSLDPQGTPTAYGINGNGAVLRVRMQATTNARISTLVPSLFSLSVGASGFTNVGGAISATTHNLVLVPSAIMRRQSQGGSPDICETTQLCIQGGVVVNTPTIGVSCDYFFTLLNFVYQGETVVVSVADGWNGVGSTSGFAPTVTNSSTITSATWAKPVYGFMNDPYEPIYDTSYNGVELLVAFQRDGWIGGSIGDGQMVAGVELWASDGTVTGPVSTVVDIELSTFQTRESKPEVFRTNVSLTGLSDTDGTNSLGAGRAYIDGYIYPWRGTRYNILTEGVSWPTAQCPTILPFTKDVDKKYGASIAYVAATAGTPAVSQTPAANKAAAYVAAYGSINLALAGLASFHNSGTGRPAGAIIHNNPHGGRIIILDTAGVGRDIELTGTYTPGSTGSCWVDLEAHVDNTGIVRYVASNTRTFQGGGLGLKIPAAKNGAGNIRANDTTDRSVASWFRHRDATMEFLTASTTTLFQNVGMVFLANLQFIGAQAPGNATSAGLGTSSGSPYKCSKARGITLWDATMGYQTNVVPYFQVGVTGRFSFLDPTITIGSTGQGTNDGAIIYNNKCFANSSSTISVIPATEGWNFVHGAAVWQNIFEQVGTGTGNNGGMAYAAGVQVSHRNIGWGFNTSPCPPGVPDSDKGGNSLEYRSEIVSLGTTADICIVANVASRFAFKSDYESTHNTSHDMGNVGNILVKYGLGCDSNVSQLSSRPVDIGGTQFGWRASDTRTYHQSGEVLYVNSRVLTTGWVSGAGWGDYRPAVGSKARNMIGAGRLWHRFDLDGTQKPNDGTACAGALEGI